MRYLALAVDYDGTLAHDGKMHTNTIAALKRLRMSGRRVVLVTGRRLNDLMTVSPELDFFDYVVAENGALVYSPRSRQQTVLGKPPSDDFIERLKKLHVPFEQGHVIVGTWLPHQNLVLQAIQELGLELLIVFNKNSIMILPPGINKAAGLDYALRQIGLSFHEAVGIGDAENDHSFLDRCECSVAVANAVPTIKMRADFVTKAENGKGVEEVIDELISNDLSRVEGKLLQHFIKIGLKDDGEQVVIPPYGTNILIAGPSGSGKSTITAGIMERLIDQTYQVCVVDPEGDYGTSQKLITLGHKNHAVSISEALAILEDPKLNLNLNLLGWQLGDRPAFFGGFFPNLRTLRTRTGRPHWVILDEAHHMLPKNWGHIHEALPRELGETILVTVHPEHLPATLLSLMDIVIAVGPSPEKTLHEFSKGTGHPLSWPKGLDYKQGYAIAWFPRRNESPFSMQIIYASGDRLRHKRKYAEGDMRNRSFYFRGKNGSHNLKAQNLTIFSVIAEGIDEETWLYHLYQSDYSKWFRNSVKDPYLADQTERIEQRKSLNPQETRNLILSLIESRYTLPA